MFFHDWETDRYGWFILELDSGWMFLIDPNYRANQGIRIYLIKKDEVITKETGFRNHFNLHAAKRMCVKLKNTGEWRQFIVNQPTGAERHRRNK